MPNIIIGINTEKSQIYLSGDINDLIKNRFAWRYIKDGFSPNIESDRIILNYSDGNSVQALTMIGEVLQKHGFRQEHSEDSEDILVNYFEEEKKFTEFSKQALHIRNNDCDVDDFNKFTKTLEKKLPCRSLYPLQLLSAYHLAFSQNACNFSVPGAGKTSIVYAAYAYLRSLQDNDLKYIDKILIVGPLSSFSPWEMEFAECFGHNPSSMRLVSSLKRDEKEKYLYSKHTAEITLVSYASLNSLLEPISFFLRNNKVMVVLDEAHKAKNTTGGIIANSILEISKYAKSRVVLTGTPAPNGYEDLYNLFKFIWPNKNVIGFQVNQLCDITYRGDKNRVDRLIHNISPYFIRIKKNDLNIPPAINNPPIIVPMSPAQQKIYDFIEKKYVEEFMQEGQIDLSSKFKTTLAQAKTIRLMQAASNPAMLKIPLKDFIFDMEETNETFKAVDDIEILKSISEYEKTEIPAKYKEVKSLVQSIINRGEKVVIWAIFIYTIRELKTYLESQGIACQVLYGEIPVEKEILIDEFDYDNVITREKIVREFHQENCPYKVIIANPFAVAESISLHKACHNAIYLERSFNAAHFVQSKDRIHRYGLKPDTKTNYYYIISKDSIDETISSRLREKEKRMVEIMEQMPIPLFNNVLNEFGNEDIKAIIKDYVRRTKKS